MALEGGMVPAELTNTLEIFARDTYTPSLISDLESIL